MQDPGALWGKEPTAPIPQAPPFPADTGRGPASRATGLYHCPPPLPRLKSVGVWGSQSLVRECGHPGHVPSVARAPSGGGSWQALGWFAGLGTLALGFAFWKRPVAVRLGGERDPLQGMRGPGGCNRCPSHVRGGPWVRWGEWLLPRPGEAPNRPGCVSSQACRPSPSCTASRWPALPSACKWPPLG